MNTHTEHKAPMGYLISRCWMCRGMLTLETAVDVYSGVSVELLVCHTCDCHARIATTAVAYKTIRTTYYVPDSRSG